jgi:vitamin B12 transporter
MKKHFIVRFVVVLLIALASPAWAGENQVAGTDAHTLDQVVVAAGRVEEKKEDVSTNITILTEEDIKQFFIEDLGDLLAREGFMIREYPNSLVSVGIRGFRTETHGNDLASHVLILINGRRAGTGNLAKIMMDNVERVEIIRGPGSVQYGASAMGGVVNVITKKGTDTLSIQAEETLGSWDYNKTAVNASGKINAFDFSFSGSKSSQDDYNTAAGVKYLNTGIDSKEIISLNTGWTFAPENRIGLTYTGNEGEGIGNPGRLTANDPDDYVDHSIKSVDLVYDGQTRNDFLAWKLRYFNGKDEYETFDPTTYGKVHSYFRNTDQEGAQAQLTADWEFARVTAGMDWTHYSIVDIYTAAGKENTYDNPAAFLLAKAKLLDNRLVLSAGGRYDEYEVESADGRTKNETNWSNSLGAIYKLVPGFSIRANYAEAFKMPTADELYMYTDYSAWGMGIWSGNENLKPEKSKTYEIGLDFSKSVFVTGLTWFHTDFDDKIAYAFIPAQNLTQYKNVNGATISGLEGSLKMDVAQLLGWSSWQLTPYASFTVLDDYTDEENHTNLQYTSEWTASYGLRLANPDTGFSSGLNFSYNSEQNITDYAGTGKTTLDGFTTVDLVVSKTLLSFDKYGDLAVKAEIRNLFDEVYEVVQGYPMPGRSFYVGLKYAF